MMEGSVAANVRAQQQLMIKALASLVIMLVSFGSAWLAYQGYPPALNLVIFAAYMLAMFLGWTFVIILVQSKFRPDQAPGWRRTRQLLETSTFLGVLVVVWLLMPWGTVELQHVTLLFVSGFCAITILSSADEDAYTRWRIAGVMGSLVAVCIYERIPQWPYLSAFLLVQAAVLILFDIIIRRSIAEMRAARVEAEEARDARTRFIAAATHDFGQPLQAARLFHEQAVRAAEGQARTGAAEAAREAFAAMERLLHTMLDHLRNSSGNIAAHITTVEVEALLLQVAAQFRLIAERQGIRLSVLPTCASIAADRLLCERALVNFIDNALRHSAATRILLGTRSLKGGLVQIFVADNGRGLAGQDVEGLFADFAQGRDKGIGGFGLGLGSARRAALAMGGQVTCTPRRRQGVQFALELPAAI